MKKNLSIISAALLLISCAKDMPVSDGFVNCSFSAVSSETKSSYYGDGSLLWSAGDRFSVLDGSGNREFTTMESGAECSFFGKVDASATSLVAAYPYNESDKLLSPTQASVWLPYAQVAVPGGFTDGANASIGTSSLPISGTVAMKNIGSYLKFTIPESDNISAVTIESNGNVGLSGMQNVDVSGSEPVTTGSQYGFVTLVPAEGCKVLAPGSYYAVVTPGVLSSGLKFYARRTDGKVGVKSGSSSNTLLRNKTRDLGTIDLSSMSWEEDSAFDSQTIDVDFSTEPFLEASPATKTTGYSELHLKNGGYAFAVKVNGSPENSRGAGWLVKNGVFQIYANSYYSTSGVTDADGLILPAIDGKRLKKVYVYVSASSNSFKCCLVDENGKMVDGGADTDASHFNASGNWLAGSVAELDLTGTEINKSYRLAAINANGFIYLSRVVLVYETLFLDRSQQSEPDVNLPEIGEGGSDFLW